MISGRPSCGADTFFPRKVQGLVQGARDRGCREGKIPVVTRRDVRFVCSVVAVGRRDVDA